jgi:hypothetical protein
MSTLKVTALKNPSSSANNIVLNTDGSISGISSSGTITANNLVINDGGGVGPTVDIKGGGTSTDSPASNEQTLFLRTRNGTTSLSTGIGFWGTFENFPSDTGARRAADIRAGFNGGTWGNEYISFHVGIGTGTTSNDSAAMTTERLRITKTAMIANGEVRATDYTVGTSGKLASNNYLQSQLGGASFTGAAGVFSNFSGNAGLALRNNFNGTPTYNVGGFSVSSSGVTVPSDGYYDCYVNLYMTSSVIRSNIGLRFYINTTVQAPISASDYIRSGSGHNEASTNLRMILYMTAGQQFRIGTQQLSAAGTVTITGANSNWIIQKVG